MNYLYLLINIFAVLLPFLFSFHPAIKFKRHFIPVFYSILIIAVPFLLWDSYFTAMGYWGFNPRYLTGISVGNLPLEEILFFIFIPFSCLFTYFIVKKKMKMPLKNRVLQVLIICSGLLILIFAILNYHKAYTFWALFLSGLLLVIWGYLNKRYMPGFLIAFLFLMIPFFIINGILTGSGIDEEVVWYANTQTLGLRILTIPVEDFFYALLLILGNVICFEYFLNTKKYGKKI